MTYSIQHNPSPDVVFSTNSRAAAKRWCLAARAAVVTVYNEFDFEVGRVHYSNGRRVEVVDPGPLDVAFKYRRRLERAHGLVLLPSLPKDTIWNSPTNNW